MKLTDSLTGRITITVQDSVRKCCDRKCSNLNYRNEEYSHCKLFRDTLVQTDWVTPNRSASCIKMFGCGSHEVVHLSKRSDWDMYHDIEEFKEVVASIGFENGNDENAEAVEYLIQRVKLREEQLRVIMIANAHYRNDRNIDIPKVIEDITNANPVPHEGEEGIADGV